MQQENQNLASINVQFGEEYETSGQVFANGSVKFSKSEAQKQVEHINSITGGQCDSEWCMVIGIEVQEQNRSNLIEHLNKLISPPIGDELKDSDIYHEVYNKGIKKEWFNAKICDSNPEKVYFSYKPQKNFDEEIIQPFKKVYDQGLGKLVENYITELKVHLSSNKAVQKFCDEFESKERLTAALADSAKFTANLQSPPGILKEMLEIIKNDLGDLKKLPKQLRKILKFSSILLAYENLDIDLKFDSSKDIEQTLRNEIFMGEEFQQIWDGEEKIGAIDRDPILRCFLKDFEAKGEIYFTIPGFLAAKAEGYGPDLSKIAEKMLI